MKAFSGPIPQVDETLAQMAGATLFSKLDVNCGFWQIPLSTELRLLTTFIMPTEDSVSKNFPSASPVHLSFSNVIY